MCLFIYFYLNYSSDRCIGGSRGSAYTHASYKFQEPNKTIMVRGLAFHHTENDVSFKIKYIIK